MFDREKYIKRLRYQSWHRGCKETDDILGAYADAHLEAMSDENLKVFNALLDEDDGEIWHWLLGQAPAHTPYVALIAEIQQFQMARVTRT